MKRLSVRTDFIQGRTAARAGVDLTEDGEDEKAIADWLSHLCLFYGVPFHYLVPDPRMLPEESIRFFQVDGNWVTCLVDGAFSPGHSETDDADSRTRLSAGFARKARKAAGGLRPRYLKQAAGPAAELDGTGGGGMSGLLIRSAVIAGWPGLQVKAYADREKTKPLKALRIDRAAANVLFCLFDGLVACITVSEAATTLHFGVMMPDDPQAPGMSFQKDLKYVDPGPQGQKPGTQIQDGRVAVDFRKGGRRVIDIAAFQKTTHDGLIRTHGIAADSPFTPAEFALELIQGVQEVDFTVA